MVEISDTDINDLTDSVKAANDDLGKALARVAQELAVLNRVMVSVDQNLYQIGSVR